MEQSATYRGRRRDPAKREAILDAARHHFLKNGMERVTMEQLAATARVSTATLYAYFVNREDVIEAMVQRESERMLAEDWSFLHSSLPFEVSLADLGQILIGFLVDPELRAFERLLSLAASRDATLARRYLDAGPGRATLVLNQMLQDAHERGIINAPNIALAANDVVGLWYGLIRLELDYQQPGPLDADFVQKRAQHGVRQFMLLYGCSTRRRANRRADR